jgi:hypothetical protein
MMMADAFSVETCGAALDGYLSHQARLHQIPQVVISGGPGTTRVQAIDTFEYFGSRRMPVVL